MSNLIYIPNTHWLHSFVVKFTSKCSFKLQVNISTVCLRMLLYMYHIVHVHVQKYKWRWHSLLFTNYDLIEYDRYAKNQPRISLWVLVSLFLKKCYFNKKVLLLVCFILYLSQKSTQPIIALNTKHEQTLKNRKTVKSLLSSRFDRTLRDWKQSIYKHKKYCRIKQNILHTFSRS